MTGEKQEEIPARRIRHARETIAALDAVRQRPSQESFAAFHELHARHLRETGDEKTARRAVERAEQARRPTAAQREFSAEARSTPPSEREQATPAPQVQYAQAGGQRGDHALQRAAEGYEHIDAHASREKAGRERSAAARRRLSASEARASASALRSPAERDGGAGERERVADERDQMADERERLADERERLADERDRRADSRDKIADRREKMADRRERDAQKREPSEEAGAS